MDDFADLRQRAQLIITKCTTYADRIAGISAGARPRLKNAEKEWQQCVIMTLLVILITTNHVRDELQLLGHRAPGARWLFGEARSRAGQALSSMAHA